MAKKQNIPVDLHGYLKFCSSCSKDMPKTSDEAQTSVEPQKTAADCQGIYSNTIILDRLII